MAGLESILRAVPKRSCGPCALCCTLAAVGDLGKLADTPCWYSSGSSCKCYDMRPQGCRVFMCDWLKGRLSEEERPDLVKAFIVTSGSVVRISYPGGTMSCGCAGRMREYVLPSLGFVKQGDVWMNPMFPEPSLQRVLDSEVELHHLALTSRMTLVWTKEKFSSWVNTVWRGSKTHDYQNMLKDAADRYGAENEWLETLSPTERIERFITRRVLPELGFVRGANDMWESPETIGELPRIFRADKIIAFRTVIVAALLEKKGFVAGIAWWNEFAPDSMQLTESDCADLIRIGA